MDRFTKTLLTVIAIGLLGLLLRAWTPAPTAHADGNGTQANVSMTSFNNNGTQECWVAVVKGDVLHAYKIDVYGKLELMSSKKVP